MRIRNGLGWILATLVGGAIPAGAQTEHLEATVLDGAGGAAAGGDYQLVSATVQPGGIQTATAGGLRNYAGFLGAFALRPDLDHDGNGLPDEWDADNDGDGLEDAAELDGRDFAAAWGVAAPTDLNAPDSDGDGAGDDHELQAGTDPNDAASLFAITEIQREGPGARVTWKGRGDGTGYRVLGRDGAYAPPADELGVVVVDDPGLGAWHAAEGTWLDPDETSARHYGVEKQ